jgi:hypothetical protein
LIAGLLSPGCVTPPVTDDDARQNAQEVNQDYNDLTGGGKHLPRF